MVEITHDMQTEKKLIVVEITMLFTTIGNIGVMLVTNKIGTITFLK